MPWFNVDDGLAFHTKVIKAGNAAMGLWVRSGSYCAQQLTDGFIGDEMVTTIGTMKQAQRLVDAGLWLKVEGGFQFHEWSAGSRNRTKAQVLADRAYNVRKAALHRDTALLNAVRNRDANRCRYCGCLVEWGNRRGSVGATYDHVDPQGPNTLENIVVACRGCNSRKNGHALADIGMTLLPAGALGISGKATGDSSAYQVRSSSEPEPNQNGTGSEQGPLLSSPLQDEKKKTSSSSPRKRGTRIPEGFSVSPEMVSWARERTPHVDGRHETEKFINYWQAASGQKAVKRDWEATWRNWMLTAAERAPAARPTQNATDAHFAGLLARQRPDNGPQPLALIPGGA